jgi:hypothetical protein
VGVKCCDNTLRRDIREADTGASRESGEDALARFLSRHWIGAQVGTFVLFCCSFVMWWSGVFTGFHETTYPQSSKKIFFCFYCFYHQSYYYLHHLL